MPITHNYFTQSEAAARWLNMLLEKARRDGHTVQGDVVLITDKPTDEELLEFKERVRQAGFAVAFAQRLIDALAAKDAEIGRLREALENEHYGFFPKHRDYDPTLLSCTVCAALAGPDPGKDAVGHLGLSGNMKVIPRPGTPPEHPYRPTRTRMSPAGAIPDFDAPCGEPGCNLAWNEHKQLALQGWPGPDPGGAE